MIKHTPVPKLLKLPAKRVQLLNSGGRVIVEKEVTAFDPIDTPLIKYGDFYFVKSGRRHGAVYLYDIAVAFDME